MLTNDQIFTNSFAVKDRNYSHEIDYSFGKFSKEIQKAISYVQTI